MTIMGIDPGSTGALAWLYPDGTGRSVPMPAVPKVGLELGTIRDLLEADRPDYVILERAASRPGEGSVQAFLYGRGFGALEGVLTALRIPFETVPSATWHRDLCGAVTTAARRKKATDGSTPAAPPRGSKEAKAERARKRSEAKARAHAVVQQRLPRFPLPTTKEKREAAVDAACLALWGQERRARPALHTIMGGTDASAS